MVQIIIFLGTALIGFWATLTYLNSSQLIKQETIAPASASRIVTEGTATPFVLKPPSAGLVGNVTQSAGDVLIEKRESGKPETATVGALVVDGETLFTGEGKVSITFKETLKISLGSNAQITVVNALPKTFLINQIVGPVVYNASQPISVRVAGTVIQVDGTVSITPFENEGLITISTGDGTAVISWVNNANETIVKTIPSESFAQFNGATDTVTVE